MFEVPSMPESARRNFVLGGIVSRLRLENLSVEVSSVFASFPEPVSRAGFPFVYRFPSIQDRNAG
jgi:hypothetical protein